MTWSYSVKDGWMMRNGVIMGVGYSGHGAGLDNPDAEDQKGIGPIPHGVWTMGTFFDHPHLGPIVSHLSPGRATEVFGRSGFFIHGDNADVNHSASDGCIVLPRNLREAIRDSRDRTLVVI